MLKVMCPAKINLTLKVFKKDEITGFHPIESIMQTVSLFDYLTFELTNSGKIELTGNNNEIEYNENNLIIKAALEFYKKANQKPKGLKIYLEKNIPVAAGLAGGSTDAAGTIFALNYIYNNILKKEDIVEINSKLGSDINFCYFGGRALAEGKGDNLTPLEFEPFNLSIIKPKNLKISTKDAYEAFDNLKKTSNMKNDLEFALISKYNELQKLHNLGFQMSGSGPSFFILNKTVSENLKTSEYEVFENLNAIKSGVELI